MARPSEGTARYHVGEEEMNIPVPQQKQQDSTGQAIQKAVVIQQVQCSDKVVGMSGMMQRPGRILQRVQKQMMMSQVQCSDEAVDRDRSRRFSKFRTTWKYPQVQAIDEAVSVSLVLQRRALAAKVVHRQGRRRAGSDATSSPECFINHGEDSFEFIAADSQ